MTHQNPTVRWGMVLLACLTLASYQGVQAQSAIPLEGIYQLSGEDPRFGPYTGQVEIRINEQTGTYRLIHTQIWESACFEGDRIELSCSEEGDKIALAWEGEVLTVTEPYTFRVTLSPVGFIRSYRGLSREGVNPTPIEFLGTFRRVGRDTLKGVFVPLDRPEYAAFTEEWVWSSPCADRPIWQNQRVEIPSHDPIPADTKASMFDLFDSFYAREEVSPYLERSDFQEGMHYVVFDATDYEFYRANSDVVRVIQKIVDPISLAEARLRSRAYGKSLADKALHFDTVTPLYHLNEAGIYSHYDSLAPADQRFVASSDGTLWTGVYAASQALRYLATQSSEAFENMRRALEGLILCFDIAPAPGDFARGVRARVADGDPAYVQGIGAYADWDWRPGANNDMLKGYLVGFTWGWLALEQAGGDPALQARMVEIVGNLLRDNGIAADGLSNEMLLRMLLWMMTDDSEQRWRYQLLFEVVKPFLVDNGNGSRYEFGISDWSGNHLNLQGLLSGFAIARALGDHREGDFRKGLRKGLDQLRHNRLGLYQLVAGTLGDFQQPPPELEEALWVMREFPAPKVSHDVDWSINPAFSLSPFPALPWKLDWGEQGGLRSLRAYPLFERNVSDFLWKNNPFDYQSTGSTLLDGGADYLFAYWFGRYYGVITPQM